MPDQRDLDLLSDLLATAKADFEAQVKHAASMDDKAQKISGLAGIFLAAAFGFLKPESISPLALHYGTVGIAVFGSAVIALVVAVIACLLAMWHRAVPLSGMSLGAHQEVVDLVKQFPVGTIDDELTQYYRQDQINVWKAATSEREKASSWKAGFVLAAQVALGIGIIAAAATVAMLGTVAIN